jgi:uncharacterized C2H2 Zn-finger protein
MKILLESKKNSAVMHCPACDTFYLIEQGDLGNLVTSEDGLKQFINCPHCLNNNDYSKAEWVEDSEMEAYMERRKKTAELF